MLPRPSTKLRGSQAGQWRPGFHDRRHPDKVRPAADDQCDGSGLVLSPPQDAAISGAKG